MNAATRKLVIARADNRCEYCHLPQSAMPLVTFHIEHIYAQQHIADDSLDNLALACPDCNRVKGPNLTTIDPATRQILVLFHPRTDRWDDHFRFEGPLIVPQTEIGRATIRLLQLNSPERVEFRTFLLEIGEM